MLMRGGAVEIDMLNGRIILCDTDKSKDWYLWKITEEQIRRRADQKGGFAAHLGGTTLHTNVRATAVACRRGLARTST